MKIVSECSVEELEQELRRRRADACGDLADKEFNLDAYEPYVEPISNATHAGRRVRFVSDYPNPSQGIVLHQSEAQILISKYGGHSADEVWFIADGTGFAHCNPAHDLTLLPESTHD